MSKSFAEFFLDQFREAMTKTQLLEKQIQWENKWNPPELVPDKREWGVDEGEFKQFTTIINFLRLTIFGVCDRNSLVYVCSVDRTREDTEIPDVCVTRTNFASTVRELQEALNAARLNAHGAQEGVKRLERRLDRLLKDQWRVEDRLKRAENCKQCVGKSWIRDEKAFKALGLGMRSHSRQELGGYNMVFCACQEKSDGD